MLSDAASQLFWELALRQTAPTLLAIAVTFTACGSPPRDPRTLPPLVSVVDVRADGLADPSFTGVIRARVESDLGFRVGGKIVERLVDIGQTVRRGQPLMRLDPADLALDAQARLSAAVAARARSIQSTAELKRLDGMVDQGAISASVYDQAKAAADADRAQLASVEAQARMAANARGYATLTADADGVVAQTLVEPGQVVAAGQTVVRLARAGAREAVVDLPETVRPPLGQRVTATLYGGPVAGFPARLRQLSQSADPVTRTYEARYVLAGAGAAAPLGATVTVSSLAAGPSAGVGIPLGALYDSGSGPGVWRVRGDRISFQPVRILALETESATVAGLVPGVRIVALGAERLRAGQQVRPEAQPGGVALAQAAR